MEIVSAVVAFLQSLPQLIKLYKSLKELFGDNWDKFLADVDSVSALVEETRNPDLPVEEKRRLRREALEKGRDLWSRASN